MLRDEQQVLELNWLVTRSWDYLHHALLCGPNNTAHLDSTHPDDPSPSIRPDEVFYSHPLMLTCGLLVPYVSLPGPYTRTQMPRCRRCCRALGYPTGNGSPQYDETTRALVAARLRSR